MKHEHPLHPTALLRGQQAGCAPRWPFAPLEPYQARQRAAFEHAMRHGRLASFTQHQERYA